MKKCKKCQKEIVRISHANNVKYCKKCRVEVYKYKEYRAAWQLARQDRIATNNTKGKIACKICGKFYKKPVFHAFLRHGCTEREYKEAFGLDHKKGIAAKSTKEKLRKAIIDNYDLVVAKNLLKNGKKTRFKKGGKGIGVYKRSPQTMERLKLLSKFKKK